MNEIVIKRNYLHDLLDSFNKFLTTKHNRDYRELLDKFEIIINKESSKCPVIFALTDSWKTMVVIPKVDLEKSVIDTNQEVVIGIKDLLAIISKSEDKNENLALRFSNETLSLNALINNPPITKTSTEYKNIGYPDVLSINSKFAKESESKTTPVMIDNLIDALKSLRALGYDAVDLTMLKNQPAFFINTTDRELNDPVVLFAGAKH